MVQVLTYQNNYNDHKFIEVHSYSDGHFSWKQYIKAPIPNTTKYFVTVIGSTCKRPQGWLRRVSKKTMLSVIEDYTLCE